MFMIIFYILLVDLFSGFTSWKKMVPTQPKAMVFIWEIEDVIREVKSVYKSNYNFNFFKIFYLNLNQP